MLSQVRQLNNESPLFGLIKFGRKFKQLITAVNELVADHATVKTLLDANKVLTNAIRASLVGDYLDSGAGLAIGSTKPNVATIAFDYHLAGVEYHKVIQAAGVALSGNSVPQSLYGGWALDIGSNKTIDIIPATGNASGYASSSAAITGIPAVGSDHIRLGTVTAIKVDVDFLDSAPSLAIGSTKTNVAHVEFTHYHAQAEYTEPALPVGIILSGGTIPQNKYGAFRLEIGADETLDLIPCDNLTSGFDTGAEALADLPSVQANHVAIGTILIVSSNVSGFVCGTTDLDHTDATVVYADGALDGFFVPGTTDLDHAEVTDVYTDVTPGIPSPGAAISVSSPATISATAVDDITGGVGD